MPSTGTENVEKKREVWLDDFVEETGCDGAFKKIGAKLDYVCRGEVLVVNISWSEEWMLTFDILVKYFFFTIVSSGAIRNV